MDVRLLTRWGSRMQGDIVSVSAERAVALADAGIGRIMGQPEVQPEVQAEPGDELAEVKAQLDALGIEYSPRIGLDKAKARLAEAQAAKTE